MKRLTTSLAALGAAAALAGPASAAPAQCDAYGTPLSGGACNKFERTGELNGSAYTQNCRQITGGEYPFTFYGEGGPFPATTAKNQGQCKKALKGFHSSFPG